MHARPFGTLTRFATALSLMAAVACTVKETEVPPLTGPSELGQSIQLQANPDVLTQDGASQSQIVIAVRNANGQPQRDVALRAELVVNGVPTDFGRLSARNVVTGADGRATLTYTAPPPPPEPVDNFTVVQVVVVPSGTDFANAVARNVQIRLVPPGVILPPVGTPTPRFSFSPTSPLEAQTVQFNAADTDIGTNASNATFQWTFGDGGTATGVNTSHAFARAGTYNVTLTVTNDRGRAASVTQFVTVGAGVNPSASFTASPTAPGVNDLVTFNASASQAAAGRRIVTFNWTFGDGNSGSGQTTTHRYTRTGAFVATLTVTDDAGRTGTATQTINVGAGAAPSAAFTFSPGNPRVGDTVNFDASTSTAPAGRTIDDYLWNFGDGTTARGQRVSHPYAAAGDYNVVLTVTDSAGSSNTVSRTVTVTSGGQPNAQFDFSPTTPNVGQSVNFDASASTAPAGRTIASYEWNFGDGTAIGTGQRTAHTYTAAGTYTVVLTVTDSSGARDTESRTVTVGSTTTQNPNAAFEFSPTNPVVGQTVNFDASASTAPSGRTITTYEWSFGDGTVASGRSAQKAYAAAGTYQVILTVIDSAGARDTETRGVTVQASSTQNPTAIFNVSPSPAAVGQTVVADASPSTAQGGATIVRYQWNWGDSAANEVCSNPASGNDAPTCGGNNRQTISHVYAAAGTYTITLTITDSNGRSTTTTRTVTVNP